MPVQTQLQQRRGTAASWTSTNPTLAAGEIGFESDTGKIKIGTGSTAWNALTYTASSTAVTYLFNATAAQTTFSGADANGLTLAYTVGAEQVYLNGALQVRGSDYTATNGTSIVLTSGALVNDVLNVIAYSAMSVADTYTQAQANALFIPDAIVDAKGDLIAATASDTVARLAVGSNGDGLVADSSTATGLRYQATYAAGKNFLINGGFDIWQRGTSSATQGYTTADRWYNVIGGTTTFSQDTSVPSNSNVQYSHKWTTGASSSFGQFYQTLERDVVRPLRGLTMTYSFWVRHTGTAFTGLLNADVLYSNSTDAYVSVSTPVTFTGATSITPTGTWTKYAAIFTVPSDAIGLKVGVVPTQVQASGVVVYLAACQLEVGSIFTSFTRAGGTFQGELAACQRYYYRQNANASSSKATFGVGAGFNSGRVDANAQFPVTMRIIPTSIDFPTVGTFFRAEDNNTNGAALTGLTMSGTQTTTENATLVGTVSSGLTTYRPTNIVGVGTGAYIGYTAEL
jgi:hypothetical protein